MNILVSRHPTGLIKRFGLDAYVDHLGVLLSPRLDVRLQPLVDRGIVFAADNDCFQRLDRTGYITMLKRLAPFAPWCKFVTVPDVVADASATLLRFRLWRSTLKYYGLPVALVAQDGLEHLPVPWDEFEALFIGGSTPWKLSIHAARLVQEAKAHGKWVHMGRVTSRQRVAYAATIGCDSVDASAHARFTERTLPLALQGALYYPTTLEGFL